MICDMVLIKYIILSLLEYNMTFFLSIYISKYFLVIHHIYRSIKDL